MKSVRAQVFAVSTDEGSMEATGDWRFIGPRGSCFPQRNDFEAPLTLGVSYNEASLRQELQAALAKSEANRLMLEAAGDGIYGVDADGSVTFANSAAEAMTGWTANELVGRSPHGLVHHSHADGSIYPGETCPISMAVRDGRVHRSDDEVFWRKDGTCFPVSFVTAPILRDGRPCGGVVLFEDISERKRREAWEKKKEAIFFAITRSERLEEVLSTLAQAWSGLFPGSGIVLFKSETSGLRMLAHAGFEPDAVNRILPREPAEDSAWMRVAIMGEEVLMKPERVPGFASPAAASNGFGDGQPGSDRSSTSELLSPESACCLAKPLLAAAGTVLGVVAFFANDERVWMKEGSRELLQGVCDLARLAIEHDHLNAELVHRSKHDHLTGLPNRLLLEDRLEQAIMQSRRYGTMVGVCSIDLDRFKQINDTMGHGKGDVLLKHVAQLLQQNLRSIDTVARQGGDEFILILPDLPQDSEAEDICSRLLQVLRQPLTLERHTWMPTASIGMSVYPGDGDSAAALLQSADIALYMAKKMGRDRVQRFEPELGAQVQREMELERELRGAVERREFSLMYQPLYTFDRRLEGFEALLRWSHPDLGAVRPDEFIPVAEKTGIIVAMGEWVLREACRQAREWNEGPGEAVRVHVNVSGVQLNRSDFCEIVARTLDATGLPSPLLEVEITETWIIADPVAAAHRLGCLRQLGVGISIDDFGAGHATFNYLQQLPVDAVKIDRSFISCLDGTLKGSAIVRAIVALAEELGLRTVAEGVETGLQLKELQETHCGLFQGYLLARPLQPEAAALLVDEQTRAEKRVMATDEAGVNG